MMIALTSNTYDNGGFVILKPDINSQTISFKRRVTKTATLDGFAAMSDMSFSFSDNDLNLQFSNITQDQIDRLEHIIQTYPIVNYFDNTGAFQGVISELNTNRIPVTLTFLVAKPI